MNSKPKHVFKKQKEILNRISKSKKILFFLDYDGTLVHFKNNPNDVKIPKKVKKILQQYTDKKKYELIIITGRILKDIKEKIKIKDIHLVALHGLHIQFNNGTEKIIQRAKHIQKQLSKIKKEANTLFAEEPNIQIEDKKYTLAFHYRLLSKKKISSAKNQFIQLIQKYNQNDSIQIMKGDKVIEARPTDWNKGNAVALFIQKENQNDSSLLPIYIGDDTTDEDAFLYLKQNGLTIYVKNSSPLQTNAQYWLKNPNEVYKFLSMIIN